MHHGTIILQSNQQAGIDKHFGQFVGQVVLVISQFRKCMGVAYQYRNIVLLQYPGHFVGLVAPDQYHILYPGFLQCVDGIDDFTFSVSIGVEGFAAVKKALHRSEGRVYLFNGSGHVGPGIFYKPEYLLLLVLILLVGLVPPGFTHPPASPPEAAGPVQVDAVILLNDGIFPVPGIELYNRGGARNTPSLGGGLSEEYPVGPHAFYYLGFGVIGNDAADMGDHAPDFCIVVCGTYRIDLNQADGPDGGYKARIYMLPGGIDHSAGRGNP